METKLLASLGKIAGLGGIALGVVLLIFQDFLKQKFLPNAGLESAQAYHVLLAFLVFVFGIAAIGVVAWIIGQAAQPGAPVPLRALAILVFMAITVLITASAVGLSDTSGKANDSSQIKTEQEIPPNHTVPPIQKQAAETSGVTPEPVSIGAGDEGAGDCVIEKYQSVLGPGNGINSLPLKYYQGMLPDAASGGDYSCVKTIIEKGANVNDLSTRLSPLMWAAKGGQERIVALLLASGASVDLKTEKGITALDFAADQHSLPTIKALVEHGASMSTGLGGFTPLMSAASSGDLPIVNYMVNKGADSCQKSDGGETAADVAHREKHTDVEAILRSVPCAH